MFFISGLLVVLSGLFYAAGHSHLGRLGAQMCMYGDTFCRNPVYLLVGAGLAAAWGVLVSIR